MNHSMDDHADMNDIECVLGKRARWLATRMAQAEASGRVLVHDRLEYAALQWTWALHARTLADEPFR